MLGCIFDVHGNLPALEAVLADAQSLGVRRYVLGGDYSALGAWPAQCLDALDALDVALRIRGNWERWVADPPPEVRDSPETMEAVGVVREALGDARVAELGALPAAAPLDDGALLCHASPGSDMEGFAPQASGEDAALLAGVTASRLVVGHTHRQFARTVSGIEVVNPGSVGMPLDGDPRAAWAVVRDDDGIELRRVAYDVDAAIHALRRHGDADWAATARGRLASASF